MTGTPLAPAQALAELHRWASDSLGERYGSDAAADADAWRDLLAPLVAALPEVERLCRAELSGRDVEGAASDGDNGPWLARTVLAALSAPPAPTDETREAIARIDAARQEYVQAALSIALRNDDTHTAAEWAAATMYVSLLVEARSAALSAPPAPTAETREAAARQGRICIDGAGLPYAVPAEPAPTCTLCGGSAVQTDCEACDGFGNPVPDPLAETREAAADALEVLIRRAFDGCLSGSAVDEVRGAARLLRPVLAALSAPPAPTAEDDVPRCPRCRHAPHGGWCPNMASDGDCACDHQSLPPAPTERQR